MSCAALLLATQLTACTPAVKALETCSTPEMTEMSRSEASSYGTSTGGGSQAELRKKLSNFNRASDAQYRCESIRRRAETLCDKDPDFLKAQEKTQANVTKLGAWMNRLLMQVRMQVNNDRTSPVLNCIPSFYDGINHWDCRLLDREAPRARIVSSADLPLTVGVSSECTFTVLPDGRLLTANHCGEEDLKTGMVYQYYSWTPVKAQFTGALKVNANALFTGQPFEDISVWNPSKVIHGRPFYILVRDASRQKGCEIQNGLYLACSPETFAELHSREAHVIGFPYARYSIRDRAETVILADGKLIYDPDSNRLLIHAAMSQGGSGGPAYIDAGQWLGGVKLDRPLYLGPMSAFSPPRPLPPKPVKPTFNSFLGQAAMADAVGNPEINYGDTLAIVGINEETRLRSILPPPVEMTGSNASAE